MKKFKIKYEVMDGNAGKRRPVKICLDDDQIKSGLTEKSTDYEFKKFYNDVIHGHFKKRIFPQGLNMDEFIAWARNITNPGKWTYN